MESKKWYGLTIPKRTTKINTKEKSVFENDDSDGSVEGHVKVKKEKKKRASETKPDEIDPTIYEYDSIYDEMKASQKQKTSQSKSKEPRYINLLLKAADKRKKESEKRVERKIQAERVKEGDAFKDKEAFVTSAYRQKMIEMEEEEKHEHQRNVLEEMMDSTKQKDLSGFYRHFLKQTVGEEKVPEFGERDLKISCAIKKEQDHPETDKSRQRSESPSGTKGDKKIFNPGYKNSHSDVKRETGKSHKNDSSLRSESKHGTHNEPDKSGHSKDKTSSHKSRSRHRSSSPSDSEGRKGKHGVEKSHKRKSDHSSYSSKHIHDGKLKTSSSSRNQEEKIHDSEKPGHSKSAVKQTSPSERHSNGRSSNKSVDSCAQKSKLDKDREEYKKDIRTHDKMEKGSLQMNPKCASDDQSFNNDKRSSSSKDMECVKSKHVSHDNHDDKVKKHSSSMSKKRENRSSDEYSENKRRKCDDDDDDDDDVDTCNSSSEEDNVNIESNKKEEGKKVPEKTKTDMITKFAKRTIDKNFDDAQARYFKRRDAAKAMS